jgi:hypothetical protein
VTRFGQCSLIGRLFSLVTLSKITEVEQSVGLLFPQYKLCINLDKNTGLATLYFFTNSSGHPAWRVPGIIFTKMCDRSHCNDAMFAKKSANHATSIIFGGETERRMTRENY